MKVEQPHFLFIVCEPHRVTLFKSDKYTIKLKTTPRYLTILTTDVSVANDSRPDVAIF